MWGVCLCSALAHAIDTSYRPKEYWSLRIGWGYNHPLLHWAKPCTKFSWVQELCYKLLQMTITPWAVHSSAVFPPFSVSLFAFYGPWDWCLDSCVGLPVYCYREAQFIGICQSMEACIPLLKGRNGSVGKKCQSWCCCWVFSSPWMNSKSSYAE